MGLIINHLLTAEERAGGHPRQQELLGGFLSPLRGAEVWVACPLKSRIQDGSVALATAVLSAASGAAAGTTSRSSGSQTVVGSAYRGGRLGSQAVTTSYSLHQLYLPSTLRSQEEF